MMKITMMSGGRVPTTAELRQLDYDYSLNDHARAMCGAGLGFEELLVDVIPTDEDRRLLDSGMENDLVRTTLMMILMQVAWPLMWKKSPTS